GHYSVIIVLALFTSLILLRCFLTISLPASSSFLISILTKSTPFLVQWSSTDFRNSFVSNLGWSTALTNSTDCPWYFPVVTKKSPALLSEFLIALTVVLKVSSKIAIPSASMLLNLPLPPASLKVSRISLDLALTFNPLIIFETDCVASPPVLTAKNTPDPL